MSLEELKEVIKGANKANVPEGKLTQIPAFDKSIPKDDITTLYLASKMLGKEITELQLFNELKSKYEVMKALDTAWGTNWIPTGFSEEISRAVEEKLVVASLHKQVNMPYNPFQLFGVKSASRIFAKIGPEGERPSAISSSLTKQIVLNAVSIKAIVEYTYELQEDSIVAMAPVLKDVIVRSVANSIEVAILDGDTAQTHMDVDVTDPDDPRRLWKGYRKFALENDLDIDAGGNPFSINILKSMMKKIGKFLQYPEDLVLVVSNSSYLNLITAPEVITVDKYGPNATILKGELAKVFNIPVVLSSYIREDLNANGVYDGATTNRTVAFLVYKPGFIFGKRRDITVETMTDPETQLHKLIVSTRMDFKPFFSDEPIVAMVRNLATIA